MSHLPTTETPHVSVPDDSGRYEVPVTVLDLGDDDVSWIVFDFDGHRWRFTVSGAELPYEVSYLQEFEGAAEGRRAFFRIEPQAAITPHFLEEQLYPQLVELHTRKLEERGLAPLP